MRLEKIVLSLSVAAFLISLSHEGVAATKTVTTITTVTTDEAKTAKKSGAARKAKSASKTASKSTGKSAAKKSVVASKPAKTVKKATPKKLSKLEREEMEIEKEIKAFEMAAVTQPLRSESVMGDMKKSSQATGERSSIRADIKPLKKEADDKFSGSANFTAGNDSNIDPDKTGYEGAFYQIEPTLNYESGNWSGSFGASIKDYADTENSELFKTNEAKAAINYSTKLSDVTKSTTAFSYLYHDERWPDYIDGTVDINGSPVSMPIRFSEFKLSQSLDFDFGTFNTKIGGYYANRDFYNLYTDYASEPLRELRHERDNNEYSLFGRVGLKAADFLELAARPSITRTAYTKREGRLPNGSAGGEEANSPLYEKIKSEISFDLAFTFGNSSITPTAVVGQTSDEALGAEDNSYVGGGLSASLVIDKESKMIITPSVMHTRYAYDNWTVGVPNGDKRQDDETSAGISASVNLSKNFGVSLGYAVVREKTTIVGDTSEEYKQEIISSGLTFMF